MRNTDKSHARFGSVNTMNSSDSANALGGTASASASAVGLTSAWLSSASDEISTYRRWGKRALDIGVAVAASALVLPFVPLIALAIKLDSRGSILYRSIRLGKDGEPFVFYKFRSMVEGAHESVNYINRLNEADGPVFKSARDPRVTRVGRFLRRTSIDEIPQLWNVLRGDMALVGPRPPIPEEVEKYEPWQLQRLEVKPGLTCLWQVSGRSKLGFNEWMRLDIQYIRNVSFLLDLKILWRTIPAVVSREGAY